MADFNENLKFEVKLKFYWIVNCNVTCFSLKILDDANSLDSNNLMRNSKRNAIADIYSSSGSEDLEHEFVENGNESRKTLPQSPATKSQQKNDANKKVGPSSKK